MYSTSEDVFIDVSIRTLADQYKLQLDVDPQREDDATPMSSYRCMSSSQVKLFRTFLEFLGFHAVVLVKTFPLLYQLLM